LSLFQKLCRCLFYAILTAPCPEGEYIRNKIKDCYLF
jgi:hypothetical protein